MQLLLLLLAAVPALQDTPDPAPERPPQARKLAGLWGVAVSSRVVFRSAPDRPHRLVVEYAFPERARSLLAPEEGRATNRRLHFRFGGELLSIEPRQARSSAVAEPARSWGLRELELRRAVLLWPDGFEWRERAGEAGRWADLGELGSLRACCAAGEERPTAIEALDAEGVCRAALREIDWRRSARRHWPRTMVMSSEGEALWDETVLAVDPRVRFIDAYFIPPDRRELGSARRTGTLRALDLPRCFWRRVPLEEGLDIQQATAAADALIARELATEGAPPVDRSPYLALDSAARPRAILLRLREAGIGPPPKGYVEAPPRPALGRPLGSATDCGPADLEALRAAAGEDLERASEPFLRIRPPGGGTRRAEVVLPLGG